MQNLTDRKKVVSDKKMTFMEKLYFPAIFGGMWITLKHLFRKNNTLKYPEERKVFAPVYRGMHVLKRDEEGRENCTACGLCAVVCPAEAITMVAAERQKVKNIFTVRKSTPRCMRSICCVVFSVAFVKKLVQKKPFS